MFLTTELFIFSCESKQTIIFVETLSFDGLHHLQRHHVSGVTAASVLSESTLFQHGTAVWSPAFWQHSQSITQMNLPKNIQTPKVCL